ncbi:MAG: site-specific integrase [Proteobacteria bacterium]|nr:site-specific integrase [Pseudomonadota bacterium]
MGLTSLTREEQRHLLASCPRHGRNHAIVSLMLGTGLREMEVCALDLADVVTKSGNIRSRVVLRIHKTSPGRQVPQHVFLPHTLQYNLAEFLKWKIRHGESVEPASPLFVSVRGHRRLSTRGLRYILQSLFRALGWSQVKGHSLRHTFCTNLLSHSNNNLALVQRAARHARLSTTQRYVAPSDAELAVTLRHLPC